MLVILRENVENLGQIGDVVKVSNGYARNFLLPHNLVLAADENNIAQMENQKKQLAKRRAAMKSTSEELAKRLADFSCTLSRKVGENEKLFGSVTANDIAEALKKAGYPVERRWIRVESPIRTLGVHPVTVQIESDVSATVKIWVIKEE